MDKPTITLVVNANNVEETARAIADLNAKLNAAVSQPPTATAYSALDELLPLTRAAAAKAGMVVRLVRADPAEDATVEPEVEPEAAPVTYEPKAVKRRGRRSKAEIEAEKAAAKAALAPATDDVDEEPSEQPTAEPELSDDELEALKKATLNRMADVYGQPGGKELIEQIKKDFPAHTSITTVPAKHFPEIARRLGE